MRALRFRKVGVSCFICSPSSRCRRKCHWWRPQAPRSTEESLFRNVMSDKRPETTSAWSPFRYSLFRALWVASIVSNLGTWMEEVGEAWLMIDQTASPLLVSLLQTADSLPIFLLALRWGPGHLGDHLCCRCRPGRGRTAGPPARGGPRHDPTERRLSPPRTSSPSRPAVVRRGRLGGATASAIRGSRAARQPPAGLSPPPGRTGAHWA